MFLLIVFILFIYAIYELYKFFYPAPNIDPKGKYVLISGCDSGFGNTLAIELDKKGFNVFAGVYSADNKDVLSNKLSSRSIVFLLDITKQSDIDSAYGMIKEKTNSLHALVNNAGISSGGHIDWISVESMRNMMDINFFGHISMTKTFLPLLITKRNSRVVNITSVAGFICPPSGSSYCCSKFALESFSDCLRREMNVWGLKVSIIEPGVMRTPIIGKHAQNMREVSMQLPIEVQERWGEEFFTAVHENSKKNILVKWAEDPIKVVRAIEHAIINTQPSIRYKPGWQSKFIWYPLSIIPAWLADFYFIKTRSTSVPPAGTKKQI